MIGALIKDQTVEKLGPKMFGFWSYDQFPYVLGAKGRMITTVPRGRYRDQTFKPDGYGGAAFDNPIAVMNVAQGEAINRKLKDLEQTYLASISAMKAGFEKTVREIAPFMKGKR